MKVVVFVALERSSRHMGQDPVGPVGTFWVKSSTLELSTVDLVPDARLLLGSGAPADMLKSTSECFGSVCGVYGYVYVPIQSYI